MARFIRGDPIAIGAAIVALLATLGAVAAAPGAELVSGVGNPRVPEPLYAMGLPGPVRLLRLARRRDGSRSIR